MGEEAGHQIEITVLIAADNIVGIECTDSAGEHAFNMGKYRAESDRIAGADFIITIDKEATPNRITFTPLISLQPGSWTAEDSVGEGGD